SDQALSREPLGRPWRRRFCRRASRRHLKLVLVAGLVALAVASKPARAVAAETDLYVSLRYEIDRSARRCWDEAKFRRSVAHRLGYDPFRDSAAIKVSIHVAGSARAVNGQVEWRNAGGSSMGERAFAARYGNCSKLMTEMSFAVTLQIELLRPKTPAAAAVASAADAAPSTPAPPAAVEPPATTPAPTAATPVPSQATPPVASAPPATVEPVAPAPAPPTARSSTEPRSSDG